MSALRAGVAKTDELAPLIFAIADKLCSGVYLLPEENNLLFYGLRIRGVRLAIFGKVIKIDCLASLLPGAKFEQFVPAPESSGRRKSARSNEFEVDADRSS